jgi:tetratricopeptide (TPR) repeat protein
MDQAYDLLDRNNAPAALKVGQQLERRRYSGGFEIQARALIAMGRRKQAITVLERGVENVPDNGSLWLGLGNYRSDDGDYEGAFAAYERALTCDYDRASITYNYAEALIRAGRWEAAEEQIAPLFETEFVRAASPTLGLYLVNLYEEILRRGGRDDEATAMVEQHADVLARASTAG